MCASIGVRQVPLKTDRLHPFSGPRDTRHTTEACRLRASRGTGHVQLEACCMRASCGLVIRHRGHIVTLPLVAPTKCRLRHVGSLPRL
eukprot:1044646-Pyramimonas_sp.AAC.1